MSVFAVANRPCSFLPFFFNDTATTEIYTLSLHDALPICAPAIGTAASASVTANRNRERIIDLLLVGGGVDRLWGSGPDAAMAVSGILLFAFPSLTLRRGEGVPMMTKRQKQLLDYLRSEEHTSELQSQSNLV